MDGGRLQSQLSHVMTGGHAAVTESVPTPGTTAGMDVDGGIDAARFKWGLSLTVGITLPTPGTTPPGTDRPYAGIEAVHALGPTVCVPEKGENVGWAREIASPARGAAPGGECRRSPKRDVEREWRKFTTRRRKGRAEMNCQMCASKEANARSDPA